MSRLIPALLAVLAAGLLALTACGGDDDDATCRPDAGGARQFPAACAADCECASGLCFTYGDGTSACTIECTSDDECPAGSQGKKCNGQGVCRS